MKEEVLYLLWKFGMWHSFPLKDTEGNVVTIIHPGYQNNDGGPDFSFAKIKINNIELVGNVEIHLKSSDWNKHHHQFDKQYDNIILHVVYDHDINESLGEFSTLEVKHHIASSIIDKSHALLNSIQLIPCQHHIHAVSRIKWDMWIDRLLLERLMTRYTDWFDTFYQVNKDWKQLLWVKLAENFGFKVNAFPMKLMAQSIPTVIFSKVNNEITATESLLFGQAGLLNNVSNDSNDKYVLALREQYHYLQHRFNLHVVENLPWKFMRMRPPNFPTIRIAQLANILSYNELEIHDWLHIKDYKRGITLLSAQASSYWDNHFVFNKRTNKDEVKRLGISAIENILINTVVPFQFFYGKMMQDEDIINNSMHLLSSIPSETNSITKLWKSLGKKCISAYESQSLIQLYNYYCQVKKCMHCNIGFDIMKMER